MNIFKRDIVVVRYFVDVGNDPNEQMLSLVAITVVEG
jgi:hypothetical protein